jgi:hypothetical protein
MDLDSIGQVVGYAQHMLECVVGPSRSSVLAAVTDLRVIKWIRVSRTWLQATGEFTYRTSLDMEDVKESLHWLLCQSPEQLGMALPRFSLERAPGGGAVEELTVQGFLGSGATRKVYHALAADSEVRRLCPESQWLQWRCPWPCQ